MTAARQTWPEREPEVPETQPGDRPDFFGLLESLRRENEQLRTALVTRIAIEQAKGVLAERLHVPVDVAFEHLRREARSRRMKLHTLAAAVVACEPWTMAMLPPDAERDRR